MTVWSVVTAAEGMVNVHENIGGEKSKLCGRKYIISDIVQEPLVP